MTIVTTFVPCFISLLEGCIKPSVKLRTAKRKPKLREQRKNEEIISSNSPPHHKRASSFTNKHEAAWLYLLPKLSRYRQMSDSVQHDEQCSSLHAEGLNMALPLHTALYFQERVLTVVNFCCTNFRLEVILPNHSLQKAWKHPCTMTW